MQTKSIALLQAKIETLRTALFFCDKEGDLSYTAHIIEADRMDDDGSIWFYVNRHGGQGVEPGELFPVTLDFYRKGIPFSIDITGMASIEASTADKLLLKVIVGRLQYKTFNEPAHLPITETIGKVLRSVFDIPEPLDEFAVVD